MLLNTSEQGGLAGDVLACLPIFGFAARFREGNFSDEHDITSISLDKAEHIFLLAKGVKLALLSLLYPFRQLDYKLYLLYLLYLFC